MLIYNPTVRFLVIALFAPLIIGVALPLLLWDWCRGRLRDYELR